MSTQPERDATPTAQVGELLVCPHCGSDEVGTLEAATIWQRATFTRAENFGGFEDAAGRPADADWHMYDSEDVGDTETVGFFCRGCIATWKSHPEDGGPPLPFITRDEFEARS